MPLRAHSDHIALHASIDKFLVRASYCEIDNEDLIDLLAESYSGGAVFVKNPTDDVVTSVSK
jgi:hypothetical protein